MNFGQRLAEERKKLGLIQEQVAEKLGVALGTVSRWEKNQSPMPSDKLETLLSLGYNIECLFADRIPDIGSSYDKVSSKNNNLKSKTPDIGDFDLENYAFVPLYNVEVSAGSGCFVGTENIITHLAFTKYSLKKAGYQPANLACVMATGDSMLPTITPKETLMIDTTKRHADGGIFVLRAENQLYIKRLMHEKDGIRVISDNPVYPEWLLSKNDDFEIIGKKVWQARWD